MILIDYLAEKQAAVNVDVVQLVLNNYPMETKTATAIFEVLASESRLSIFRLLVKYAPDGLVAGEIARMLDIPKEPLINSPQFRISRQSGRSPTQFIRI